MPLISRFSFKIVGPVIKRAIATNLNLRCHSHAPGGEQGSSSAPRVRNMFLCRFNYHPKGPQNRISAYAANLAALHQHPSLMLQRLRHPSDDAPQLVISFHHV